MFTIGIVISYIFVLVLGYLLGIVVFIDLRYTGDIMIRDEDDCLTEIRFKPGTDISIVDKEFIVLRMKRKDAK